MKRPPNSAGRSGDRPGLISPAAWFESTPRYHGRHKPEAADLGHASRPTGVGVHSLRMADLFDQTFTTARRETDDSTPFPRASSGPTSGHFSPQAPDSARTGAAPQTACTPATLTGATALRRDTSPPEAATQGARTGEVSHG